MTDRERTTAVMQPVLGGAWFRYFREAIRIRLQAYRLPLGHL